MNTANNARRKESVRKIEKAYLNLVISRSDITTITVSDICKKAQINRTTFYSNFMDMDELLDDIKKIMLDQYLSLFKEEAEKKEHSYNFLKLFQNIKENPIFYRVYFKLGLDFEELLVNMDEGFANSNSIYLKNIDYHIAFFKAGITAVIQRWLENGCRESPEEMSNVIGDEYVRR